jgi:putative membrane protein
MDYMMGGGWFMWIFLLIIIGVVVYMLMNANATKRKDLEDSETPLDILKRRYANGDITQEEYEEKKRNLGYEGG